MKAARLFLFIVVCLTTTLTQAAGFSVIEIPADRDGPTLHGAVWFPCNAPAGQISLAPVVIEGTRDCAVAGTRLPLIVMSHGTGGEFLSHHDTAAALADAGFVVSAINHPGDTVRDLTRQGHISAFATRPVDLRRLTDYMLAAWTGHAKLDPGRVGVFGFSRGGYTGLAAIGATPNFKLRKDLCPSESTVPACAEISRNELPPPPVSDPRIKAAVIVDPLSFFDAASLKNVTVPIQLWASEYGGDGVTPESVEAVRRGLPNPPEWRVAANAAHFAFIAPCTSALVAVAPEICIDKNGFDRIAFHKAFNEDVVGFFRRNLMQAAKPDVLQSAIGSSY